MVLNLRGESDDSLAGNGEQQEAVRGAGEGVLWVGAEGHSPTPGAEWGGRETRPLPSVLKEKALGSVSSCPTLSMEEVGSLSLTPFKGSEAVPC